LILLRSSPNLRSAAARVVNELRGVLDSASVRQIERRSSRSARENAREIAVVTLADIGDRSVSDGSRCRSPQWALAPWGCRPTSAGTPAWSCSCSPENHRPGTGDVFISVGRGAGFPHRRARRPNPRFHAAVPRAEDYARRGASPSTSSRRRSLRSFGFTLTVRRPGWADRPRTTRRPDPIGWILALVLVSWS